MTLSGLVSIGLVSGLLLPPARDCAGAGDPLGMLFVGGFWFAVVAALAGAPAIALAGIAVMVTAGACLMFEWLTRCVGRR